MFLMAIFNGHLNVVEIWNERFCCRDSQNNNSDSSIMWLLSDRPCVFQLNSCARPWQPDSVRVEDNLLLYQGTQRLHEYAFHEPSPHLSLSSLSLFPPAAAHCCQMSRCWACWRMAKVQSPPSGFKCSSSWVALTPTSSSTAMSRSVTAPQGCVSLWVNPVTLIPHTARQKPVQKSSLLYVHHESLI